MWDANSDEIETGPQQNHVIGLIQSSNDCAGDHFHFGKHFKSITIVGIVETVCTLNFRELLKSTVKSLQIKRFL